jgi:ADP-heptose:LPS heptosyltransferase
VLNHNPRIDRLFTFGSRIQEVIPDLKKERYDLVIDLHRNIRSLLLRSSLRRPSVTFDKLNIRKFLAVNIKWRSALPKKHIVDRYFECVTGLGIVKDSGGLEYYTGPGDEIDTAMQFFRREPMKFIALVIGGSYTTKKIPLVKLQDICANARMPVVLLGGKEDKPLADELRKSFPHIVNCSGLFTINQSASVIRQSEWVITSDTGMMHIAAAYGKKIVSVWGNTIPEFGMEPYKPAPQSRVMEVYGLKCRPCSKLGFSECPRRHFKCMMDQDFSFVSQLT